MRILLVRLSALGDIVHALPAVSDLRRALPHAHITVAVDERFADIPRLHPGINEVLPLALKRWKKNLFKSQTWRELAQAIGRLRGQPYDLVVDLHGLNKSAAVTWLSRASLKLGPHPRYCGEWLAPKAYHQHCAPPDAWLPVPRMRAFVAQALKAQVQGPPDYGLAHTWQGQQAAEVALIHSTSAADKLWPEADWIEVGRDLIGRGLTPVLPWGSGEEKLRAERLAQAIGSAAQVGPALSIQQWTERFSHCRMVIGVDTGLTHLAAAAGVPCLALFMATGSDLFTPQRPQLARALGGLGQMPTLAQAREAIAALLAA